MTGVFTRGGEAERDGGLVKTEGQRETEAETECCVYKPWHSEHAGSHQKLGEAPGACPSGPSEGTAPAYTLVSDV